MPTKDDLIAQLKTLTANWNDYEDIPESQQSNCARIGRDLNALGGMALMQDAYYAAKAANRYVGVIQAYWNDIGDWRW